MKGWYGDPYRHSLAARGIPTYLYHGTTSGLFRGIKKHGLSPHDAVKLWANSEGDYIYLTPRKEIAEHFAGESTRYLPEVYDQMDDYVYRFYPEAEKRFDEGEVPQFITKTTPIILRVRKEDLEDLADEEWYQVEDDPEIEEDSIRWPGRIPPELIEVRTPTGWKRLRR